MENWRKQEEGRRRGGGRRRQGGGESEGTKTIVRFGWREETESALVRLQLCGQMAKYKKQNKKTAKEEGTPRTNLLRDGVGGGVLSGKTNNSKSAVMCCVCLCVSVQWDFGGHSFVGKKGRAKEGLWRGSRVVLAQNQRPFPGLVFRTCRKCCCQQPFLLMEHKFVLTNHHKHQPKTGKKSSCDLGFVHFAFAFAFLGGGFAHDGCAHCA